MLGGGQERGKECTYICVSKDGCSLGPRPKTNPSADRFQYRPRIILEAIYVPDDVW